MEILVDRRKNPQRSRFNVEDTPLDGLKVVTRKTMGDARGEFSRVFCARDLKEAGFDEELAQINFSKTAEKGTVRGFHFQMPPHGEIKLVSCVRGAIFDVVVDVRAGSPTFLQHFSLELSAKNGKALLIPKGFAHGFQVLEGDAELLYCHSEFYEVSAERGLNIADPVLKIKWPLAIVNLSQKDMTQPMLTKLFEGVNF